MPIPEKRLPYPGGVADDILEEILGEWHLDDKDVSHMSNARAFTRPFGKAPIAGKRYRLVVKTPSEAISLVEQEPPVAAVGAGVEAEFRRLADEWLSETAYLSDPVKIFMHRSHIKIIGMGEKVLPLILREVERMSGDWLFALDAISPENPVRPEDRTNLEKAAGVWLQWGKERGLI